MAQQPKQPEPRQPQHQPAKPEQPQPRPGPAGPAQPQPQQQPPQQQPRQQPPGQPRGEGVPPPAEAVRDERDQAGPDPRGRDKTGKIPGTPWTPPEGHDHAEPAPGEPGGISGPAPSEEGEGEGEENPPPPPVHTIADEQRMRSAEVQKAGVSKWVEEHDERTTEERQPRQVPGVGPTSKPEAHEADRGARP